MDAQQISTTPDWLAPLAISQAFRVGDLLFLSGQGPEGRDGGIVGETFEEQVAQAMLNLDTILTAAGSSRDQIVKVTIYVTDMANYDKVLDLRRSYFTVPYPADTIVEVNSLACSDTLIEIDAIALVGGVKRAAQ